MNILMLELDHCALRFIDLILFKNQKFPLNKDECLDIIFTENSIHLIILGIGEAKSILIFLILFRQFIYLYFLFIPFKF